MGPWRLEARCGRAPIHQFRQALTATPLQGSKRTIINCRSSDLGIHQGPTTNTSLDTGKGKLGHKTQADNLLQEVSPKYPFALAKNVICAKNPPCSRAPSAKTDLISQAG